MQLFPHTAHALKEHPMQISDDIFQPHPTHSHAKHTHIKGILNVQDANIKCYVKCYTLYMHTQK